MNDTTTDSVNISSNSINSTTSTGVYNTLPTKNSQSTFKTEHLILYYFNIVILIIIGVLAILTVIYFFLVTVNKYDDTPYKIIGYSFLGAISIFTIVNSIMLDRYT